MSDWGLPLAGFATFEKLTDLAECLEAFPQATMRAVGSGKIHKSKPGAVDQQLQVARSLTVARKVNAAYALDDYAAAKQALDGLHHELMHLNPSAARSLAEGLEETLTVHRLHVPQQLRMTLANTNVIESAFSIVERVCLNVKRWHPGDQRERWVGSGLLVAEKQFRRVKGHKQIPVLLTELDVVAPCKSSLAKRRKAS
jgi:putative transposase